MTPDETEAEVQIAIDAAILMVDAVQDVFGRDFAVEAIMGVMYTEVARYTGSIARAVEARKEMAHRLLN